MGPKFTLEYYVFVFRVFVLLCIALLILIVIYSDLHFLFGVRIFYTIL